MNNPVPNVRDVALENTQIQTISLLVNYTQIQILLQNVVQVNKLIVKVQMRIKTINVNPVLREHCL